MNESHQSYLGRAEDTKVIRKQRTVVAESTDVSLKDYDMWALGITIVIGGQYFAWNAGLSAGFGSFFIATFLIASAYACLILCISELSSGLPFAGGSYGLARVTAGIYP
jgi:amino acid transporter